MIYSGTVNTTNRTFSAVALRGRNEFIIQFGNDYLLTNKRLELLKIIDQNDWDVIVKHCNTQLIVLGEETYSKITKSVSDAKLLPIEYDMAEGSNKI